MIQPYECVTGFIFNRIHGKGHTMERLDTAAVGAVFNDQVFGRFLDDYEPVPITPDLLVELFGFHIWNDPDTAATGPIYTFDAWAPGQNARFDLDWRDGMMYVKSRYQPRELQVQAMPHIKHIHNVQALYWALTGEPIEHLFTRSNLPIPLT